MNNENECLFIYKFDYISLLEYSWCFSKAHNIFLRLNVLINSVSSLCVALVSEVGGISEETAACDWWSLGAILFELLTGMVSHKVPKKKVIFVAKVLSDVCRCLGSQLCQTLYGSASLCVVLRVCVCG